MLIKPVFLAAILVAAFQIDINGIKRTFIEIPKRWSCTSPTEKY